MATVNFDTSEVEAVFKNLGVRAKNFDQSLLTQLLLEHVEEVFDSEGTKGRDGKWEPLKASTIERNPSRASGALLFDTGLLANFQTTTRSSQSIVWSPASYIQAHVEGVPDNNLPARNPFAIKMDEFMFEAERLIAVQIAK